MKNALRQIDREITTWYLREDHQIKIRRGVYYRFYHPSPAAWQQFLFLIDRMGLKPKIDLNESTLTWILPPKYMHITLPEGTGHDEEIQGHTIPF